MEKIKEVKFNLEGLTCADCAGRIENELNNDDMIKSARVDMVLGKAIIELDDDKAVDDAFIQRVTDNVHKIEDIPVYLEGKKKPESHGHDHDHDHIKMRPSLYMGVLMIVIRLFVKANLALDLLTIGLYILVSLPIFKAFVNSIRNKQYFDETVLMTVATVGAIIIGEYGEALGVMVFYSIGEYFQHKAVDDSRASIKALLDKRPDEARLLVDGQEQLVDSQSVQVGDHILVLPSDQVPLDGKIISGQSSFDMSSLTGESVPVNMDVDAEVMSGSLNLSAPVTLEVTKTYSNSTINKLLDLIENSSKNKAETEVFMTKFSNVYTPIVFALSVIIMLVVGFKYGDAYSGVYRGLVFLVISCPCALVLSIPLSYFAGIGRASRSGILIKGGESIENLSEISGVVFDKTGTLTTGVMAVNEVVGDEETLTIAAHLESYSNHPIGKAIVKEYGQEIDKSQVTDLEEVFGKGIQARYQGSDVFVGSLAEVEKRGYDVAKYISPFTSVAVVKDEKIIGVIYLKDQLRSETKDLISALHDRKLDTYILSGDRQEVVDNIAAELNIDHAYAELLPDDKVKVFDEIRQKDKIKLAYVGDGMNDAAVLGLSDVGFSMGSIGNDLAIEYSDVVLVDDNPMQVIEAMDISKKTQRITIGNIIFILFVKVSVLILGSLGYAKMWQAVIADVGVSLLAVLNAMRIMRD